MAARQTLVGLFVLVGLGLAMGAVLVFGSLHLLSPVQQAVIYFHGGVGGLAPGAPVTFRGVRVGSVETISLYVNPVDLQARIPVTLQLDTGRVLLERPARASEQVDLPQLVAAGLRGQLVMQSFVTGQMAVDLDIQPNSGAVFSGQKSSLVEIPTIQSEFEQLREQIPKLPLRDLAESSQRTLHSIEHLADTLDTNLPPLIASLPPLIASLKVTADGLHDTGPLINSSVQEVRDQALQTIAHYDALSASLRGQVAVRGPELARLLATANQTADHARHLTATIDALAGDRSEARLNLETSLRDLAAAADSLRGIARDVESDPSLVLRGRAR
ncbi:MlaD family protein [Lichenicola sp.]|uniref:MlaD family protein n=1 Tax=Lichenicola sp. TaxID=2804529 RepID=UPI003AFFDF3E